MNGFQNRRAQFRTVGCTTNQELGLGGRQTSPDLNREIGEPPKRLVSVIQQHLGPRPEESRETLAIQPWHLLSNTACSSLVGEALAMQERSQIMAFSKQRGWRRCQNRLPHLAMAILQRIAEVPELAEAPKRDCLAPRLSKRLLGYKLCRGAKDKKKAILVLIRTHRELTRLGLLSPSLFESCFSRCGLSVALTWVRCGLQLSSVQKTLLPIGKFSRW